MFDATRDLDDEDRPVRHAAKNEVLRHDRGEPCPDPDLHHTFPTPDDPASPRAGSSGPHPADPFADAGRAQGLLVYRHPEYTMTDTPDRTPLPHRIVSMVGTTVVTAIGFYGTTAADGWPAVVAAVVFTLGALVTAAVAVRP